MSDYHSNIFYSEEDGGYIADIPDLESCSAFGQRPEAALGEVERAKVGTVLTPTGRIGISHSV